MNLVKREGASGLVMTVLIWSVVSVLGTRLFLSLTGNPTIGYGRWHIAHVLFGGIFMMLAMMLELIFKNKDLKKVVAIMFGIGWGLFIDEVGKFLTHDNDYWFRPAAMIIYVSFIMLFLTYKYLERKDKLVKKSGKFARAIDTTITRMVKKKIVAYGLWLYSIYYSVEKIIDTVRILASQEKMMMIEKFYRDYDFFEKSDTYLIVFKIIFDIVAAMFFLLGARYFWSKKRSRGVRFFKYGLYINILIGSVFKFYFEQMGAVFDVLINILLLEILSEYKKRIIKK
jgi:hypothetical protein